MSLHSTTALSPVSAGELALLPSPMVAPRSLSREDIKAALRNARDGFTAAFGHPQMMPDHCLGQALASVVTPTEFRELMIEVWNET